MEIVRIGLVAVIVAFFLAAAGIVGLLDRMIATPAPARTQAMLILGPIGERIVG